jgi:hypothetical protein
MPSCQSEAERWRMCNAHYTAWGASSECARTTKLAPTAAESVLFRERFDTAVDDFVRRVDAEFRNGGAP